MEFDSTLATISAALPEGVGQAVTAAAASFIPEGLSDVIWHAQRYFPKEVDVVSTAKFMLYFSLISLILGILAGLPFALLRIPVPTMFDSALKSVGGTATPIALMVVGTSLCGSGALKHWKLATVSAVVKLFLLPAIFLPIAGAMGFRDSQMIAILIMVGSPTTVACYIMAKNMKADSVLTANALLLSTLLSAPSITLWLCLMRLWGWI